MRTKSFLKAGHLPTLAGAFLYFDVSFMVWVLLGALGNYVAAELGLNAAQKGLMTAIPLLGGSILRLVLGYLTDRIGARKTGIVGMTCTLLPLMGGWLWADSLPEIYIVGLLLGVAGASFAAALPMASRWYPPEYQGLAMGIAGAGNSGTLLATFFAPRLAELFGWHAVFGLAAIPLTAVLIYFVLFSKDAPGCTIPKTWADYASILREKDTYCFCLLYGVTFGGFVGLASFLSILLKDQFAVSKVAAGDLTSLCVIAGSFLRPVGGFLADRLGGIRMLRALYVAVAALLLAVSQLPALAISVGIFFCVMGCLGMGNGAVFQLVPQRFAGQVGVITGVVGAAGGVGGFFLPTLLGWFKQAAGSYGIGLAVLALAPVAAFLMLGAARRSWVGNWIAAGGRVASPQPAILPEEVEPA